MSEIKTHTGSCHCGAVRFQAELDLGAPANRCNCTFCMKTQVANVVIKPSAFKLLAGADDLVDYQKEGHPNHMPFCRHCGTHVFGYGNVEELGGDFYAVNVNCLDDADPVTLGYIYWDGRHNNWASGPRQEPWPAH